ncbi:MAG TPA: glycosyltransferase family 4 protein [Pirellulaceae bacterium]|nr:glycosyltransferase family 4 protein [Pirellulaceae bacterium]
MKTEPLDARVVVLTHYLPPYVSSVFKHLAKQIKEFQVLLSIDQEPNRDFGNTWADLSVTVQKSWMLRRKWRHRKAGFQDELYVHFPYDTYSQLRRRKPDIVFSYELGFRSLVSAIYCWLNRKKLAICVCVSERTEHGRGKLRYLLRRFLLRRAHAVTYNGPSCLAYLKRFKVDDRKLYHFPYACSDQLQYTGSIERSPSARRRLLVVGQLTARKGVMILLDSLIEYCAERPSRHVELDFVGRGNLEDELQARELPANLQVRFLGSMGYGQISTVMEDCGMMLFPTLADEWGLVVNEGMRAGMPVIGSEYAQASTTLIQNGENGWRYRPDCPQTLFDALDALYTSSDERLLEMRYSALATEKEITSANVAAKALKMFHDLCNGPDTRRH